MNAIDLALRIALTVTRFTLLTKQIELRMTAGLFFG